MGFAGVVLFLVVNCTTRVIAPSDWNSNHASSSQLSGDC